MMLDPVLLSRVQWGWVVAWHIMLPAFTVGLASYIAVLEALYFITQREIWFRLSGFWTRIFAVSFGMGVVSGIIMPFQFGTNWSRFSDATANVLSPLFAYEGLMAFFLEASFLAAMGAFFRRRHGRVRNTAVLVLDPCGEQLDANTARPPARRWPL
jgi:cytochrome d ubiquinol oxidase subunit I